MKLSAEILDHIFSFLVSDKNILRKFLKDPLLYPIVERHFYYHITVSIRQVYHSLAGSIYDLEPNNLFDLVSENPRILHYVRILEIHVVFHHDRSMQEQERVIERLLDKSAKTLRMFSSLECIMIATSKKHTCQFPETFRAALEDQLRLPTIQALRLAGNMNFPFSVIDKNIKNLTLWGSFDKEGLGGVSIPSQLESLTLLKYSCHSLLPWIKPRINELRSLKCAESNITILPELLEICSHTLSVLDVNLEGSPYVCYHDFETGEIYTTSMPDLFPIPQKLQQLIIHATVWMKHNYSGDSALPSRCSSNFPAAAQIISTFSPSLQHLTLDLEIALSGLPSNFEKVDFSPLAVLEAASLSIPRIDLYVYSENLPSDDMFTIFLSSLADYEGIMKGIKEGVIIIHPETSPAYIEQSYYWS